MSDDDSTSWSEDEDFISTYLLCGPPGIGKTATVYALAAELGYKVSSLSLFLCTKDFVTVNLTYFSLPYLNEYNTKREKLPTKCNYPL